MSRRTKIILLVIGGVSLIFSLIWFIMRPQVPVIRESLNVNTSNLPQASTNILPSINTNSAPFIPEEPKSDINVTLKTLAAMFAERYGSFSNQSDYKNLSDLSPLMTAEFAIRNKDYIQQRRQEGGEDESYFGMTSKTIKNKLINLDEKEMSAELQLTMQRKETKDSINSNERIYYQDIIVRLEKDGGEWKVSEAQWQSD